MKVLLIGKGGREHAMAWKLSRSSVVSDLLLWPGNPAMNRLGRQFALELGANTSVLAEAAVAEGINLVVVGPEGPLSQGVADAMLNQGIPCFGPSRLAALLEASKAYAKDLMFRAGIPTAKFNLAQSEEECLKLASDMLVQSGGVVLKASGLAAGKGVFVCRSHSDIEFGLKQLYSRMPEAAETIVVEELLEGRECSYFIFLGHGDPVRLGFAVDFKRLRDGDKGPNTGGMGCYTPVPWLAPDAAEIVDDVVVRPLLKELDKDGLHYVGCLYVGLMWTKLGPKVIEFNVRLGDPEAQILAAADSRDWGALMAQKAGAQPMSEVPGGLEKAAVGVVMASAGYPFGEGEQEGVVVPLGLLEAKECPCFVAAATKTEDSLKTASGRVFTVVGSGSDLTVARNSAYRKVHHIAEIWPDAQWRTDIAKLVTDV